MTNAFCHLSRVSPHINTPIRFFHTFWKFKASSIRFLHHRLFCFRYTAYFNALFRTRFFDFISNQKCSRFPLQTLKSWLLILKTTFITFKSTYNSMCLIILNPHKKVSSTYKKSHMWPYVSYGNAFPRVSEARWERHVNQSGCVADADFCCGMKSPEDAKLVGRRPAVYNRGPLLTLLRGNTTSWLSCCGLADPHHDHDRLLRSRIRLNFIVLHISVCALPYMWQFGRSCFCIILLYEQF